MREIPKNEKILVQFVSSERKSLKIIFWKPRTQYIVACISKSKKNKDGTWEDSKMYLFKEDLEALGKLIPEAIAGWPESTERQATSAQQELPSMKSVDINADDIPF